MNIEELEKNYNKFIDVLENKLLKSKSEILEILDKLENNALEILLHLES